MRRSWRGWGGSAAEKWTKGWIIIIIIITVGREVGVEINEKGRAQR